MNIILFYMKESSHPDTEAQRFDVIYRKSGLTPVEFAASLGVSESHFYNMLRGVRQPSREVLAKLVKTYSVDMNSYLFGYGAGDTVYVELDKQAAAAGRGTEVEGYIDTEMIALPRSLIEGYSPKNLRAVLVRGDSMIDERICDGDTVVYDTTNTAPENISVLSVDNTLLVKRVVLDGRGKTVTLLSANPAYPPRVIRGADAESVRIAGKVVAVLHRV
jgi:SOS-response transcriptional repressor LexA